MKQVEILLPKPFDHGFDYLVPEGMEVSPGDYVRVQFGRQSLIGVVWGAARGDVAPSKLKPVSAVFHDVPPMPESTRRFIDWVSRYTLSYRGMVLKMALPVEEAVDDDRKRKPKETAAIHPKTGAGHHKRLSSAQQEAADALANKLDRGFSVTVVDGVTGSGKTEVYFEAIERVMEGAQAERLPCENQKSFTGQNTKQALVLLPEIALSTQWVARCRAHFGFEPVVWHSGLTPARRRDVLRAIMNGEARLIVGARSALFLPYRDLRLVVVDEEHEQSYKQEDGVLYHARDMAVARGHIEKLPVVLVSATPSLETVYNLQEGRYGRAHLPERHGGVRLPEVELVDMREEKPDSGTWISSRLRAAIAGTLGAGRQVMLFLNRRGYAPLLLCRGCGHRFACPECSGWMVLHGSYGRAQAARSLAPDAQTDTEGNGDKKRVRQDAPALNGAPCEGQHVPQRAQHKARLICHHCDHREPVPSACPACGKEDTLVACGPGVERVAEEVAALFPQARVEMMTSDTMDSLRAAESTVADMTAGKINVLVGTQMMAKGYHFPNLHLIGVVDADLGLQGGDLRAGERTYQLLHQVAGRAGREQEQGRVLLQTYLPEHPVMQALVAHDRDGLQQMELAAREDAVLPPYGRLAALIVDGAHEAEVIRCCRSLAMRIPNDPNVRVLGPAPAPLIRLRGRYRYRFLIRAPREVALQAYLQRWLPQIQLPSAVRLRVDIDPYQFL